MPRLYSNNTASVLATAVAAASRTIVVREGHRFPSTLRPGDSFFVTIESGSDVEVCLVIAHARAGTAMTVIRGLDLAMPAKDFPAGAVVEMRIPAEGYREFWSTATTETTIEGDLRVRGTLTVAASALGVPSGGTGSGTLTDAALLVGRGMDPLDFLPPGTAGNILASANSVWGSRPPGTVIDLAAVNEALDAGALSVPSGGTGVASVQAGGLLFAETEERLGSIAVPPNTDDGEVTLGVVEDGGVIQWAAVPRPAEPARGVLRVVRNTTTAGQFVWAVPGGITKILVTAQGGGEQGWGQLKWHDAGLGEVREYFGTSSGAAAGEGAYRRELTVTPGAELVIAVGNRGAWQNAPAGNDINAGGPGGDSYIYDGATKIFSVAGGTGGAGVGTGTMGRIGTRPAYWWDPYFAGGGGMFGGVTGASPRGTGLNNVSGVPPECSRDFSDGATGLYPHAAAYGRGGVGGRRSWGHIYVTGVTGDSGYPEPDLAGEGFVMIEWGYNSENP